jgi:hypothetical protein
MKKLLAASLVAVASSAALADNPAGCGLGTAVVFPDADEWHEYVLAATTNGSSGNQTFGITSGTLGCENANGPLKVSAAQSFINDNMDQLALDVARGEGETLTALGQVMGIESVADQSEFAAAMQSGFDRMFTEESDAAAATRVMQDVMASNDHLQKYLG